MRGAQPVEEKLLLSFFQIFVLIWVNYETQLNVNVSFVPLENKFIVFAEHVEFLRFYKKELRVVRHMFYQHTCHAQQIV